MGWGKIFFQGLLEFEPKKCLFAATTSPSPRTPISSKDVATLSLKVLEDSERAAYGG